MTTTTTNHAQEQAAAQVESIAAMVAATECDFDRLEELKTQRDDYQAAKDEADEARANVERHHSDVTFAEALERDFPECAEAREALAALENETELDADDLAELAQLEEAAGEYNDQDEAREAIQQDALSVQVRSDWHDVGDDAPGKEFCILLCTGGPAVRIIGTLNDYNEPESAQVEYQDWGTAWTEYRDTTSEQDDAILSYCRAYYFGE